MEPNETNIQPDTIKNDISELHNEGVDIVGSSVALNNEFGNPEDSDQNKIPVTETEEPATKINPSPTTDIDETEKISPEPQKITPASDDPSIKNIRTFKSDAEEAIRYGKVSKIDIAVAESKKREGSTPIEYSDKKNHTGMYIISILGLIIILCGGWYYWFSSTQAKEKNLTVVTVNATALVTYSKATTVLIDTESNPLTVISAKLAVSTAGIGNVFAIVPVSSATSTTPTPISEIMSQTNIPNRLLRSLDSRYMIGLYAYDLESPFIIMKNTYYQNAFSGMLDWEKNLGHDLSSFIHISYPDKPENMFINNGFEDGVLSNIDVRILKDSSGQIVLTYAFPDKDTIIITTNLNALKYLLDRTLQVRTIQ